MLRLRDGIFSAGRTQDTPFVGFHLGDHNENDGMKFSRKVMIAKVVTNPAAAETIVVGGKTYTFRVTPTLATEIKIGNLISNGDFANGDDGNWINYGHWTVDATGALHTAGTGYTETLVQEFEAEAPVVAGGSYVVAFTISGIGAGSVTVSIGGTSGSARSTNDTFTETIVATDTTALTFTPTATFDGKISAVTVTRALNDLKPLTAAAIANRINLDTTTTLCTAYVGTNAVGLTNEILLVANSIGTTPTFTADGAKVISQIDWTLTILQAQLESTDYFKVSTTVEAEAKPTVLVERNAGTDKNFLY